MTCEEVIESEDIILFRILDNFAVYLDIFQLYVMAMGHMCSSQCTVGGD